ncbi:PD-(D/E)XK motif protein [Paenibacillus thiaminolyticus]|uniref:PD-(D/E)XK motif protein n=1 Tax=Paenibacillus thiaminolyticus TaxID=49283 RepID=UPI00234FF2D4|nr:PD-(D/E)XK motif protein [Paenibacillus thiaminolyticus]WCR24862.1 PD-(D/E)XK motif protein [Paenibacillus thiaminolyticus]
MNSEYILSQIKLLQSAPRDDKFVLFDVTEIPQTIYYGVDNNKNPVFVIESLNPHMNSQLQCTKKLFFSSNTKCEMIINGVFFEKTVHILTCLSSQPEEQLAFVRLTESFSKHLVSSNPYMLNELFSALVNLFAQGGKIADIELQGLFAELYVIKYFMELGINIGSFWQKRNKMNFDFTINRIKRMEVKSTIQSIRIHHFKHEQLLSDLYDIMIVSCLLRKDDAGLSLFELIQEIRIIAGKDYRTLLYIEQLIKNIPEEVLHELKYDETYFKNNIRFFPASSIPKFNMAQPDGVTQTEYNSNLCTAAHLPLISIIEWLNEKEGEVIV